MSNEKEIKRPYILRPSEPQTNSVAIITVDGNNTIRIEFDHRNEDLIETCKQFRFRWQDRAWQRSINKFSGAVEDRITEIAYFLLQKNIIVCVPEQRFQKLIENAEFEDEHTRWIKAGTSDKNSGFFYIYWDRRSDDLFYEANQITGAVWLKYRMRVSARHFEEIEDFADLHGFRFSEVAQDLLEKAKKEMELEIRVELKPRKKSRLIVSKENDAFGLINELKDNF